MQSIRLLPAGLLVLALAACGPGTGTDAADPPIDTEPGAPPVEPTVPSDVGAEGAATMRYDCEGDWSVEIAGDIARVTAGDGRLIELERVPDRSPPLFAGEALEFSIGDDGAVLGQDEGGPFACEVSGA